MNALSNFVYACAICIHANAWEQIIVIAFLEILFIGFGDFDITTYYCFHFVVVDFFLSLLMRVH